MKGLGLSLVGLAVIALAVYWARRATGEKVVDNAEAEITEIRDGFSQAYASGDVETLVGFYDEQYVDASSGSALRGKTDMRATFDSTFARYDGLLDIRPDEVLVNHGWAIERGAFTLQLTDRSSGDRIVSHRRYLEILVHRPGYGWRIFRDLDNEFPPSRP